MSIRREGARGEGSLRAATGGRARRRPGSCDCPLAATIAAANLAHATSEKWLDDLWFEVATAGVQVVAVGVLWGALAAVRRTLSAWSDGQREQRAKLREELVGLFTLSNDVKRVRRIVKSQGLDLTARHRPVQSVVAQRLTEQTGSSLP